MTRLSARCRADIHFAALGTRRGLKACQTADRAGPAGGQCSAFVHADLMATRRRGALLEIIEDVNACPQGPGNDCCGIAGALQGADVQARQSARPLRPRDGAGQVRRARTTDWRKSRPKFASALGSATVVAVSNQDDIARKSLHRFGALATLARAIKQAGEADPPAHPSMSIHPALAPTCTEGKQITALPERMCGIATLKRGIPKYAGHRKVSLPFTPRGKLPQRAATFAAPTREQP